MQNFGHLIVYVCVYVSAHTTVSSSITQRLSIELSISVPTPIATHRIISTSNGGTPARQPWDNHAAPMALSEI
eukprot:8004525-Pyramimonas_sp.AAC.1